MSVLEKLKALDSQRAELLEGAKKEALDKAEKAIAELNELGFNYRLVEGACESATQGRGTSAKASNERCALPYMRVQNDPAS